MGKISRGALQAAIEAYEDCVPLAELAQTIGVSRQGLWKAIRKSGVNTKKGEATRRDVTCDQCGKVFSVTRSRYRLLGKSTFCSDVCYYITRESADTSMNRHKQRIARWKVSQVFDLTDEMVVHHADKDHFNTMMRNFLVFANQGEHTKYHHEERLIGMGKITEHEIVPVWDGANFKGPEPTESMKGKSAADWAKTFEGKKEAQKREHYKSQIKSIVGDDKPEFDGTAETQLKRDPVLVSTLKTIREKKIEKVKEKDLTPKISKADEDMLKKAQDLIKKRPESLTGWTGGFSKEHQSRKRAK